MKFTSLNHFLIVIVSIGGSYAYTMRDQLSSDISSFNNSISNLKTSCLTYSDRVKVAISPLLNNANFNEAVNLKKYIAINNQTINPMIVKFTNGDKLPYVQTNRRVE